LQNVFCKAYNKIRQFEGHSQFSTWLTRIAINEALMMLRKRRSEALTTCSIGGEAQGYLGEVEREPRDRHADPERQYLTKELTAKAFRVLPPTLRRTFVLQKGQGWTSQELAGALDITAETVKSRIFRARVRLREELVSLSKTQSIALQN
jgi:RNA polymerase sigma-70 factor, ECF subfamily